METTTETGSGSCGDVYSGIWHGGGVEQSGKEVVAGGWVGGRGRQGVGVMLVNVVRDVEFMAIILYLS